MKFTTKADARAKVGDTVRIDKFVGDVHQAELDLIGKTGVVQLVDDLGTLHGTWGSLGLLVQDKYTVIKEADHG
jgi:hypothetical protein